MGDHIAPCSRIPGVLSLVSIKAIMIERPTGVGTHDVVIGSKKSEETPIPVYSSRSRFQDGKRALRLLKAVSSFCWKDVASCSSALAVCQTPTNAAESVLSVLALGHFSC